MTVAVGQYFLQNYSYDALWVVASAGVVGASPTWWVQDLVTGQLVEVPETLITGSAEYPVGLAYSSDTSGLDFSNFPGFTPIPPGHQVGWSPGYGSAPNQRTGTIFGVSPTGLGALALWVYLTNITTGKVIGALVVTGGQSVGAIVGAMTVFPYDLVDLGTVLWTN